MPTKFGIIAEDVSDVDVVKSLAKKLTGKAISASHFVGKGCGSMVRKAPGWCKSFERKGCTRILLVHDLDRHDLFKLTSRLEQVLEQNSNLDCAVIVPVEEIEAWLLSDMVAIANTFKLKKSPKGVNHPESIQSPKEYIQDLVWKASERKVQYVNSIHNRLIAERINIANVSRKCPSFKGFADFVSNA
jgi:Domain of unknown function (DUF4276)